MKKVFHILSTNKYSGAENIAIHIVEGVEQQYKIKYVSPDGEIKNYFQNQNLFLPSPITYRNLKKLFNENNPDVIHAHDFNASVLCAMINPKSKIISHIHCNPTWIKRINLRTLGFLFLSARFNKIVLVSDAFLNEFVFKKFIKNKCLVLENTIKRETIISLAESKKTDDYDLIFIGRLTDVKQPFEFIKIVANLKEFLPNISAVMVGQGDLKDECEALIKKYSLKKNVKLVGFQKNPYTYLKNSKLLVMPSVYEGFGLAAIEALILGKPVLATKVGGLKHIVNENCGDFIESTEDAVQKIVRYLQNKDFYIQKSKNAMDYSYKYTDYSLYLEKIKELYQS